ncbi:FAD-binding protein [Prauserella cavernicola]|uniref:L-aspartate oxidase n=1 Tax=Prauserella cavernicola TaxID=2800127 RepID=A0A934QW43_9PSEU|nr:FAD-binding protein [Prauserella cavernicola]MBK1787488.1 FAD-binding protein [Prauserella cavernicola]
MSTGDALEADVLVLGGGPAGAWAALSAAESGARVVLADKGYCGTSGATASGGNNLWHLPPGPRRDEAILARQHKGAHLTDAGWMDRVLDTTYRRVGELADWGYPFPHHDGVQRRSSVQGPEYMRRMRRRVHRAGVRILDHHPALELLADSDGVVSGAAGLARQREHRPWRVSARAVVIATGGCAFLSGGFGTNVDTGDGLLIAAEAGAELSGMEFSTAYALSPKWGVHTKGLMLQFASYYDERGTLLDLPAGVPPRQAAALLLARGQRVFARLDRAPRHLRAAMREAQPNYFLPLEKAGVDVFTQTYPLRLVYEGTVRGSGGLRVLTEDCATTVPGLFAAGDAATRELVTGAISGGGSHNGAWAISSGTFAGRGAAGFARRRGRPERGLAPLGRAGLRPTGPHTLTPKEVVAAAQEHILPPHRSYLRAGVALRASRVSLEGLWRETTTGLSGTGRDRLRARQAASLVAHARWITAAALARAESRGMHRRTDLPQRNPALDHRILTGGLDEVWTRPDPVLPVLLPARDEERAS